MMADSYQFTLDWDLPAAASIASSRGAGGVPMAGMCSHVAHRAVPRAAKWFWMFVGAGGMYWFLSRRAQRQALLERAQAKRKIAGKAKAAKVQKEEWVIRLSKEVVGADEEVGDELEADTDEDDRDSVQVRRKTVCLNRKEATETAIEMLETTLNSISLAVDGMKTKLAERRTNASPSDGSFSPITAQEAAL